MQRLEVEHIFERKKANFLRGLTPCELPVAVILGGQPASGKSKLTRRAQENHPDVDFLIVNGDLFREYHPQYKTLIEEPLTFSEKTQIFSNVFTERLIQEAIKNRFNIIVEGTMRNPKVPLSTAKIFRDAGFRVEAYVIAAPALFSEIGCFNRYQKEVAAIGVGRLADINSHNEAVKGLPCSVDALFSHQAVDKIVIYSFGARENIRNYNFNGKWDSDLSPTDFIEQARENQLNDKNLRAEIIRMGEQTLNNIAEEFKNTVSQTLEKLKGWLKI
ncbi:hypothetical protein SAMD00024442_3_61 [Candidatus Symbiothrix dinenymphae]|nr:hypothetical protein SAMD00024442_3_61 [Candidatus Symbiothrix dinenymphae]